MRWVSYNGTAVVALVVNTLVFALADRIVGALPAALAGVAAGTVVTFLVCDRLIFASSPASRASVASPASLSPTERLESSLWESVS